MKRTTKTLFIATLALLAATPALARSGHGHGHEQGYGHARVLERLDRQHTRIKRGIKSGELTRREARRLKRQQHRIRRLVNELYDDDRLSRRERQILNDKLDQASDRIYALKHNDDNRYQVQRSYRYWIDEDGELPRYGYAR